MQVTHVPVHVKPENVMNLIEAMHEKHDVSFSEVGKRYFGHDGLLLR